MAGRDMNVNVRLFRGVSTFTLFVLFLCNVNKCDVDAQGVATTLQPTYAPTRSPLLPCTLVTNPKYMENVKTQNALSTATSVVSCISTLGCLAMILVIFSYSKTRIYRERLLLGMATANLIFSIAQIPPIWTLDKETCWRVMPVGQMVAFRCLWFGAKFAMVFYEICIVGSSIIGLHFGQVEMEWWREVTMHGVCLVAFLATFLSPFGFTAKSFHNWQHWGPQCFFRLDPDRRDASTTESPKYDRQCIEYVEDAQKVFDEYQQLLMTIWLICASITISLAIVSRIQLHFQLKAWERASDYAAELYARDYWSEGDKPIVERKQKVLNLQKQAYLEITKPLEPYVVMFVVFMGPSIPMATSKCASTQGPYQSEFCMQPCELLLTFRAYATVIIYFLDPDARKQLFDVKKLCHKFHTRVKEMFSKAVGRRDQPGRVGFKHKIESVYNFEAKPDYVPSRQQPGDYAYAAAAPGTDA